jgi:hypothetical protein
MKDKLHASGCDRTANLSDGGAVANAPVWRHCVVTPLKLEEYKHVLSIHCLNQLSASCSLYATVFLNFLSAKPWKLVDSLLD